MNLAAINTRANCWIFLCWLFCRMAVVRLRSVSVGCSQPVTVSRFFVLNSRFSLPYEHRISMTRDQVCRNATPLIHD